jgi:small conductance mechanosensitive channel
MNEESTLSKGEELMETVVQWLLQDGINIGKAILMALIIFVVGKWIAGAIKNKLRSTMEKRNVDPALISFGTSIIYYVLMIAVVLAAVQQVGFQTTSLVAVLGAAGLAVGLALQGSLSNFASGVLIIMFRPFKIGDFIDAGGQAGVVQEIGVLVTIMKTPDNKKIIQPNSAIMSGAIVNVTANDTRRVDMTVGVSYSDDLDKVQNIILDVLNADSRVLQDPAPQVVVAEMADSSVNFNVRPWCATGDYWGVFFDFQKTIKQRLDQEGVSIPFPQQDVYMHQVAN